jgi:hypothetical protein
MRNITFNLFNFLFFEKKNSSQILYSETQIKETKTHLISLNFIIRMKKLFLFIFSLKFNFCVQLFWGQAEIL